MSWISSSSNCFRIELEASSPIITIRMAILRIPGIRSTSPSPILTIVEPGPDYLRHGGWVGLGFRGDVLGEYVGLLGYHRRAFELHQRLPFLFGQLRRLSSQTSRKLMLHFFRGHPVCLLTSEKS